MDQTKCTKQVGEDLNFVKSVVMGLHHDLQPMPRFMVVIWVGYFVIGFGWLEFAPSLWGSLFLALGAPIIAMGEQICMAKQRERTGRGISLLDRMMSHHMLAFLAAFACFYSMGFSGQLNGLALLKVLLILSGYTLFTFGIYTRHRPLMLTALLVVIWAMSFEFIGILPVFISGLLLAANIVVIQIPTPTRED